MNNQTENIKCQNDKEIIKNQGITILTTGRALKSELKKTKLLMNLFENKSQMQEIIKSLVECPECSQKVDEYLKMIKMIDVEEVEKNVENCIYFNECIECKVVCNKYMESVV